jgi:BASS family bile acid:Na+ symporter
MADRFINVLVTITLIEMMVAVGLGVRIVSLIEVAKTWRFILKALIANYLIVPAATVALLLLVKPEAMVGAGFLILAVCPGAPFAPACTKLAKGNEAAAVGLMVFLAGSSAIAAPVLLQVLMPLASTSQSLQVDGVKMLTTLLATQLLPLCVGLAIRHFRPGLAQTLQGPANRASAALSVLAAACILVIHFHLVTEIRLRGYAGMLALLVISWAGGCLLGGPSRDTRKAMALTTSLRNVGVGLVIATGNFGGTAAVTATLAYGLFEIAGSLLLAWWWGRRPAQAKTVAEAAPAS